MCGEINLGSVDYNELNERYSWSSSQPAGSDGNFHEVIFSKGEFRPFTGVAVLEKSPSTISWNTQKIARNCGVQSMGSVSAEAGVTYEWGGKDGGGVSGYVSGSAKDDNGNKAEVEVTVNDDGSGSATVSVSHDEDK